MITAIEFDTSKALDFDGEALEIELELLFVHTKDGALKKIMVLATENGLGGYVREWTEAPDDSVNTLEKFLNTYPSIESILEEFSEADAWAACEHPRRLYVKSLLGFEGVYPIPAEAPVFDYGEDEEE